MILLERRGRLVGLVTVKDVLKYMAHVENSGTSSNDGVMTRDCGDSVARFASRLFRRNNNRPNYMPLDNNDEIHEMHTTTP